MLKFKAFDHQSATEGACPLRNAHLIGADGSTLRAEVTCEDGVIYCEKREVGPAALALQHPVGDCGELTVQTCLLPDRDEPYLLNLELARHRLMTLYTKLEDWGMFELSEEHPVSRRVELARKLFVQALCKASSEPTQADKFAKDCLVSAVDGSEELALAHAGAMLNKRKANASASIRNIGARTALSQMHDRVRQGLVGNFDFVNLPMPWKALVPEEGTYHWGLTDNWFDWAQRQRLWTMAGPIVSFDPTNLPDWTFIWEHDYDTIRELLYEHVEKLVTRYRHTVKVWNVVSGLHVNQQFTFSLDQLMDLTRMTTLLVRKLHPSAKIMIELVQPFGEYFGKNPRSIPPMMYADLLIQGAVNFDMLGIKLLMGQAVSGQYTRDLMQISNLLDQFAVFGKPLHVSLAAPSEQVTELMIASDDPGKPIDANCGYWRKVWSPVVQSHWLEAAMHIALGKTAVESVSWAELVDHAETELPLSGLINEDLQPKVSLRRLMSFRKWLADPATELAASKDVPADDVEHVAATDPDVDPTDPAHKSNAPQ